MKVRLTIPLCKAIGVPSLAEYGLDDERSLEHDWVKYHEINLAYLPEDRVRKLVKLVETHSKIRGSGVVLKECALWLELVADKDGTGAERLKIRTVEHFVSMAIQVIGKVEGHRIYETDAARGVWMAYYVEDIQYHPRREERNEVYPEYATMSLWWIEFGKRRQYTERFDAEDCVHMTVAEALARQSFVVETPELRAQYLRELALYDKTVSKVGMQHFAHGVATDNLDGNGKNSHDGDSWRGRTNKIRLDHDGTEARVVVDVFRETDKESSDDRKHLDRWFWNNKRDAAVRAKRLSTEDPMYFVEDPERIEVPVHPMVACFDLKRHTRLRIHISQMRPYVYDEKLSEKLVLTDDVRSLVNMLVSRKAIFKDVIGGKGGGAIILCAGSPGTGKTLTAEVYAESMGRPLYTVQASQLGLEPDEMEDALLRVFARSQRWNAILLIDEADVYVAARSSNLTQNAIVGVFLRVLEYFSGTLFLTTNRSDLVDDAIASRCIARIDYAAPTPDQQRRIWRILADNADVPIADDVIDALVKKYPGISGRDVKNLLKLSSMLMSSRGEKTVTVATVDFAHKFKPTKSYSEKE